MGSGESSDTKFNILVELMIFMRWSSWNFFGACTETPQNFGVCSAKSRVKECRDIKRKEAENQWPKRLARSRPGKHFRHRATSMVGISFSNVEPSDDITPRPEPVADTETSMEVGTGFPFYIWFNSRFPL